MDDGGGLENRYTGDCIVGSNPTPSAIDLRRLQSSLPQGNLHLGNPHLGNLPEGYLPGRPAGLPLNS